MAHWPTQKAAQFDCDYGTAKNGDWPLLHLGVATVAQNRNRASKPVGFLLLFNLKTSRSPKPVGFLLGIPC